MQHAEDENLTENIALRVSADQRTRWEKAAAKDRRTLSDWIRLALDDASAKKARA